MLNNRDGTNEKPQLKVAPSNQGRTEIGKSNSTVNGTLKQSHSRYDKGMALYKEGKVKVGANGLFKVSGYYEADTERMTCTCPDYKTRKESCKHLFAAMLFVKNRGKATIEHLEGNGANQSDSGVRLKGAGDTDVTTKPETKPMVASKQPSDTHTEPRSKDFDRQATINVLRSLTRPRRY